MQEIWAVSYTHLDVYKRQGYGGGIKNKIKLLELEKNDMTKFIIPTKGTAL